MDLVTALSVVTSIIGIGGTVAGVTYYLAGNHVLARLSLDIERVSKIEIGQIIDQFGDIKRLLTEESARIFKMAQKINYLQTQLAIQQKKIDQLEGFLKRQGYTPREILPPRLTTNDTDFT